MLSKRKGMVNTYLMKKELDQLGRCLLPKDPWAENGKPIPEMFPTWRSFFEAVALGTTIAFGQFAIFAILIIRPWR